MNILLSTDNKYLMPTGVLMHSIGENNGSDVHYHILTDPEFSESSVSSLRRIAERYNNTIAFYTITSDMTRNLPFGREDQPKGVTIATYYRLFISKVLPESVHKIIYLDGDMIVRKSLDDLWNTDMTGYALGAVHDMHEAYHCTSRRLPYQMEEKGYLNAGMLLINLDYWREHECLSKFMKCVDENFEKLIMHDQDVLNVVLHNEVKWLPATYNFQSCFLEKFNKPGRFWNVEKEIEVYKRDPAIVHFTAEDKPWKIEVFHTYTKDWRRFFFMSEWGHEKLEGENATTLKQIIRNYLVRHCLYTPPTIYEMF